MIQSQFQFSDPILTKLTFLINNKDLTKQETKDIPIKAQTQIMEIYFENTPNIGNLYLEHIFYEYGEPILFVCCGSNNRRYLCSCCKLSERWILSQVSEEELIQLIDNSISIRSLFESRTHSLFMVSWDGVSLSTEFDNIAPEFLPDAKPLELPKKETDE